MVPPISSLIAQVTTPVVAIFCAAVLAWLVWQGPSREDLFGLLPGRRVQVRLARRRRRLEIVIEWGPYPDGGGEAGGHD